MSRYTKTFYKNLSKHGYYQYLGKYEPFFIAKHQSDVNHILGRRGNYETLVRYFAGNHLTIEEDHSYKYKTPWWFVSLNYTLAWFMTGQILVITLFFLGDPGKVFNTSGFELQSRPSPDSEVPAHYEAIYITDREIKW